MGEIKAYTIAEIEKYLRDNGFWVSDITDLLNGFAFLITISGDWRHDHLRLKHFMKEIGFEHLEEDVTESDGDDYYTAKHRFGKTEFVKLFN